MPKPFLITQLPAFPVARLDGVYVVKKARLFLSVLVSSAVIVSILPTSVSAASVFSVPNAPASPASQGATSSALSVTWSPPSSGPTPFSYQVFVNDTLTATSKETFLTVSSLSPNTSYDVSVSACNGDGCSSVSDETTLSTKPSIASSVKAVAKDGGLQVSFTPSGGPLSLNHKVWYKPLRSGTWSEWTPGVSDTSGTLVSDLTNGASYSVKVESSNSSYSVFSLTVSASPAAVPSVPSLSHNQALSSVSSIATSWTASSANGAPITGYNLYRNGTKVTTANSTSYVFAGLAAGTTYALSAEACNSAGCSAKSQVLSVATKPAAPATLSGAPADGSVVLTFASSPSANVAGYTVFYKASTSSIWIEHTPGINDTSPTTVTGLINATTYQFKVSSLSTVGSTESRVVQAIPRKEPAGPIALSRNPTQSSLEIYWTTPESNGSKITSYEVYRNDVKIGSTTGLAYVMSGLTAGTNYTYQVAACNASGCGVKSSVLTVPTKPLSPSGLSVAPASGRLALTWTNSVSPVVTSHNVFYRLSSSTAWVEWTSGTPDSSVTVVTGLKGGTAYSVKVTSCNASGCTDSVSATGSPRSTPDTPTLTLDSATNSSIKFSFTPGYNGGAAITSYELWSGGTKKATSTLAGWTFSSLTPLTSHSYSLKACNAAGCSDLSAAMSVTTAPLPPTGVTVTSGLGSATIVFVASPLASRHKVEYKLESATTWTEWTPDVSDVSPVVVTGLNPGVNYNFKVGSQGPDGPSAAYPVTSTVKPQGKPEKPATSVFSRIASDSAALTKASLRWSAPANNGGSAITGFEITANGETVTVGSNVTTKEFAGLSAGRKYPATIKACNTHGCSEESVSLDLYTAPVAIDHSDVTADPDQTTVALSWPASDAEALTGYKVRQRKVVNGIPGSWSPSAPTSVSSRASRLSASSGPSVKSTTYTLSGLSPNTSYEIQVAPYNSANSDATWPPTSPNTSVAVSTAPLAVPGAPSTVSVSPTDKGVSVSWTAPSNTGGSPISGYRVRRETNTNGEWVNVTHYPAAPLALSAATPLKYNVSSLVNGTQYRFSVVAINATGDGTYYDPAVVATPRTIPGAPTGVTAVGGESKVTLSWTAPASNGGAPIDYYEVKYRKTGTNDALQDFLPNTTGTTAVIEGLTNGTSYTFQVKAHNEAGFSGHTTKPATPTSTPGLPSGLAATAGDSSIAFSWQPPTFTGGIAVTGYEVSYSESLDGLWAPAQSVTATSHIITGLTNGIPYYLQVAAKNSAGTGTPAVLPNSVTPRTVPGAPTAVIGIPDNGKVTVSWDGPLESGGSDVTGYIVEYSSNGGLTFPGKTSVTNTSHVVTGLTNGVEYHFRVTAKNAAGDSLPSAIEGPFKPRTTPSQPGVVTGTASDTKVALSWAAPSNNGGAEITDYIVEYTSDNGVTTPVFTDGTRATTGALVTGLTNGTAYKFRVKAVNEASILGGTATNWSAAITPYTTPGTPSAPSGTAGNEQVLLTWTAPENGGSAITSYKVDYSANDWATSDSVTTSSAPSHTVTGLQNGYSYKFRVTAQNAAGPGSASDDSQAVTPRTVPTEPAAPTAEARNASALVSWSAPSDGGSAITDYEVQFSFNNGSAWTTFSDSVSTDNSTTVTGLTNGTKYVFRVRAINAAGPSLWSAMSSVVTPYTSPGAPGKPTGTAKDASVTLTWTPAVNNGSAVSNHVVYYSVAGANDWSDGVSSGSLTTHTVTGLQNGTQYVFRVKAENAADFGPLSSDSDAVKPFGEPGKPTVLEVVPGNSTLDLSWSAPSDDGGAQVEDYVLQFSMNNGSTWSTWALYTDPNNSTLTQHTLTGLINGNSYKLRVAAKNKAGVGEWSDESAAVKPRTSPLKPGKPVADPDSEQIGLVWAAPSSDGGSDITDYRVQYGVYPVLLETDWQTFQDEEPSAALSAVVTGLQNGTQYVFRVAAKNAAGWSDYSLPSSITAPYTTPGKPTKPSGVSGSKQVTLNWPANGDDGGDEVTDFKIQFKIANTDTWSDFTDEVSSAAGALVTGLTDGTQYVFRVAAYNAAGDSAWSDPSDPVTPYSKTSPPTWSTGSAADASVTIAWQEPSDLGGGSVSGYTLRYSSSAPSCDNGAWVTAFEDQPLLTKTVTGLTNGANYRFCVAARNQAGLSLWSDVSSLYMPVTAPGLVVSPATKIAPSSVEVSWTKPASDGGSLITKYQVQYAESGEAWPGTPIEVLATAPLKTLVSGLENGTEYKFRIRAVSNHSPGEWSADLVATPYTNPDAPTGLVLFARALEIEASWAAPTIDGGMPVTKYQVKYKPSSAIAWFSFETTSTSAVIPNLTRNTSYDVQIIALNPLASSALAGKVTTAAAFEPYAPTITSVERGYRFLTVTFSKPASDGGADITKYQYSTNNGAHYRDVVGSSAATTTFVIDKLSVNVAALLDDTSYQVKIRAYNAAKLTGAASLAVTQKTAGRPGVLFPVLSQARPDDVSMHFTWPAIDPQGTAVTDYEYSTDDGATWNIATTSMTGTDVSATVTLTSNTDTTVANGTWYKVKWRAKNLVGYSDASIAYDVRPRTVPDAPTIDSSSGQNQRATLDVSQADVNGGAPVENYEYSYRVTNVAAWGPWIPFNPTTTADTLTVTGLGINVSYDFRVRTVNEAGPSLESNPSTLLTHDYPGAPSLDSYIPANNQITALFSIPDYNGRTPVNNYQYSLDGGAYIDFTPQDHVINSDGSESGRLVFASPSGQWRTLKMRTINDVGPSPDSNVMSVIAAYPPSAPRSLVVSRNLASLSLSWQEPSDLGFVPILNHEYSVNNGDWGSLNTTSISSTIADLPHCTSYTLIIRAVNVAGNGAQSTPASNSTFCKPSTPAAPGVAASERKVTVTWIAPANGGTSITGYAIQRSTNGGTSWSQVTSNTGSTTLSFTDNASNNTAYVYRVAAINAVDTGTYSGASVSATPVVPPPSGVTKGTVTASQASFSWNASGSTHLASSNKYRVYRGTTYLASTNDTTYTATGLSENTAYTFYVYAVDNLDTWSSAASASITSGNTPIWATSASAVNNGSYYSAWSGDASAARREINWALNPADGQNYSRTDVYVREFVYYVGWGSWGLVGTTYGSEAGVSGSFTQGGNVAVRPSYSYQTLLRVWDTYGGSNDYVYETATHSLGYRSVYKNRVGYVNNSAGEITDWTACSAQSTTPQAGSGASAWATCAQAFDRDTTSGWMSGDLGCGTSCNSTHTNWIVMDTGDTRHYLGKSAYEQGYPQNPGSEKPSYTLTSVKIYMMLCHNVKIEIDYNGGNNSYYADTATGPTQYCAGWHDVNLTNRGVGVTNDSHAFWSAKLTIGNPRTYCCSGYSRRVRVAEIQFGVSYWYDGDSEFR